MSDTMTREQRVHESKHGDSGWSIVELMKELTFESSKLVRQELELARAETQEKVSKAGRNAAYLGVGAIILLVGTLLVCHAAGIGLATALMEVGVGADVAPWLSYLIVGGLIVIAGYIFVQKAISTFKRMSPLPERTIESIEETRRWAREKARP